MPLVGHQLPHREGSGHLCQAPSILWTQVPGPEGNGVFKMHVRDGLKPQTLDQRCKRHSFKCSQHSEDFESSGQAFQPPGKLRGSAGASLHRMGVTEGGAQGVGGRLLLPLPPSPHCPPARGRMLHLYSIPQLFNLAMAFPRWRWSHLYNVGQPRCEFFYILHLALGVCWEQRTREGRWSELGSLGPRRCC